MLTGLLNKRGSHRSRTSTGHNRIDSCAGNHLPAACLPVLQVNLELLTMDKRTFVTDHERALQSLFGENSDSSPQFRGDISSIAARLATVFASLKVGTAVADASASIMPGGTRQHGRVTCIGVCIPVRVLSNVTEC